MNLDDRLRDAANALIMACTNDSDIQHGAQLLDEYRRSDAADSRSLWDLDVASPDRLSPEVIEALYDEGVAREQHGDLQHAAACFEGAARHDFADAALRLGVVLERQRVYTEARHWYCVALAAGFREAADLVTALDESSKHAVGRQSSTRKAVVGKLSAVDGSQALSSASYPTAKAGREVVNYAMQRRALLAEVYSGRVGVTEVCDATPYLLRAAKFHGEPISITCPMCRQEPLMLVSWVYGDVLKHAAGSARTADELNRMAALYEEFSVFVVEVCQTCRWNHLVQSYVLGARNWSVKSVKSQKASS